MDIRELEDTCKTLEKAMKSIPDTRLNQIYAEYYVAYHLAIRGLETRIGDERDRGETNSDIYICDKNLEKKRVEVKSAVMKDGWATFSFGNAGSKRNQMVFRYENGTVGKFDYCVAIAFSPLNVKNGIFYGYRLGGVWVISREELMQKEPNKMNLVQRGQKLLQLYEDGVSEIRKEWAYHPSTNNCLLYIAEQADFNDYKEECMLDGKYLGTIIEEEIHSNPKNYLEQWNKILQQK